MAVAVFPDDFIKRPHPIASAFGEKAWQWTLPDAAGETIISVVGGCAPLLHGDGITTFEMWDYDNSEPTGWLSAEAINEHLRNKGIEAQSGAPA